MATEQESSRFAWLRAAAAAFGAVLLVWAIGVGLYSALVAQRIPCGKCGDYYAGAAAAEHVAVGEAWVAVGCAALMVAVLVYVRARRRGGGFAGGPMGAWVVLLLVWALVALLVLPETSNLSLTKLVTLYRRAMTDFTVTDQLPTAVVAVALAAAGAVAAGLGAGALARGGQRWPAAAGAVLAVLVGVTASTAAVRAGDDARYVEATTAAPVAVPAVPDTLGHQRFHLSLARGLSPYDEHAAESFQYAPVFAGGAGFVVWRTAADGVFGYDGAGQERWHYRRTGPAKVRIVQVHLYDQGKTVVLKLSSNWSGSQSQTQTPTLVGLDALTGAQLWSHSGAALADAFDSGGYWTPSPFLVARNKPDWIGFDARTGRQIWQIPNPLGCGGGWDADTASRLAGIEECDADQHPSFRLVTVDPRTGQVQANRLILTQPKVDFAFVKVVSSEGILLDVGRFGSNSVKTYINAATGQVADVSGTFPLKQLRRVGDLVADAGSPDRVILYGPDGRPRCDVPGSARLSNMHAVAQPAVAWLGHQFVYLASEHHDIFLRVTDRATCATVATLPDPWNTLDLMGAPGVTLVRSLTADGEVVLDGYAP
ncbi:PQQ-binding-like beta-propeller repeat protein [Mycobacterium branderi]|uniref:PQQ-binding-like beta-propeller repeat protein n=1 Tax=Mycobacterium branderi TaxID=43348 RepID=A0ABM7KWL2_9MYCO|nr:PQQ-binding-like beta-propeller repeat protein [Mycobacterium branderi]MCV7231814.1 PQQ-binding-like beta-propeller repeat protein [Mycobacterium branderi]BBZ15531.1 hypothetical protein MBRA_57260 [Mycobacterium branderi]